MKHTFVVRGNFTPEQEAALVASFKVLLARQGVEGRVATGDEAEDMAAQAEDRLTRVKPSLKNKGRKATAQ